MAVLCMYGYVITAQAQVRVHHVCHNRAAHRSHTAGSPTRPQEVDGKCVAATQQDPSRTPWSVTAPQPSSNAAPGSQTGARERRFRECPPYLSIRNRSTVGPWPGGAPFLQHARSLLHHPHVRLRSLPLQRPHFWVGQYPAAAQQSLEGGTAQGRGGVVVSAARGFSAACVAEPP